MCAPSRRQRILILGLGQRSKADPTSLFAASSAATKFISTKSCLRLALAVPEAAIPAVAEPDVARLMAVGLMQGCVGPGLHKSKADRFAPQEIWLVSSPPASAI